ncbi:hypothetical protein [Nocardiopsis composta]|uniref:Uncharacterized protein n=1 Tax=Nocardiopsis composta TaxID=157465 RepID=A0A7W8QRB1_9ACTN|nr:hypothetical protein [Nocardiopsis composta]MBB5435167.1 hypothetical protein [Nocardiopsis composta]
MQWLPGGLALYLAAGLIALARTPDPALMDPDDTCSPACRHKPTEIRCAFAQVSRPLQAIAWGWSVLAWPIGVFTDAFLVCRCHRQVLKRARRRAHSQPD